MLQRLWNRITALEAGWGRVLLLAGFLLPTLWMGYLTAAFTTEEPYPPIFVLLCFVSVLGTVLVLALVVEVKKAWIASSLIVVAGVLAGGYSLFYQHKKEQKEKEVAEALRNDYFLVKSGYYQKGTLDLKAARSKNLLTSIRVGLKFNNGNSFPIYTKSVRRMVEIKNTTSGDKQENAGLPVPAFTDGFTVADSPIIFKTPVDASKGLSANIDYLICYGRDKGAFPKAYEIKGQLMFEPLEDGGVVATEFYPSNETPEGHSYTDCPTNYQQ